MRKKTYVVVSILVLLVAPLQAQEKRAPREREQGQVVGLTSELVELDAVVNDADGRPISDLKKEEFTVYENGVVQELVAFDRIVDGRRVGPAQSVAKVEEAGNEPTPESSQLRYSLIFLTVSGELEARQNLAGRMDKLFAAADELIGPQNPVAVAVPEGVMQDFTVNRESVYQALRTVLTKRRASDELMRYISSNVAPTPVGPASLRVSVSSVDWPSLGIGERGSMDKRVLLQDFARLIRALSLLPGRKQFIWFNSGFMLSSVSPRAGANAASGGERNTLEGLTDLANRSGVSFYVIDARGLSPVSTSRSQDAPIALANATGGRSYRLNFAEEGLRRAAQDAHHYYRLAYYPTNTERDGKFRRIEVKVSRRGATVLARGGYLAPKEFAAMTEAERRNQLVEALLSGKNYRSLPVVTKGYVFLSEEDEAVVSTVIEVGGGAVPVQEQGGKHRGSVEFLAQILAASGEPKSASHRTMNLELSPEDYEELRHRFVRYTVEGKLPPGEYRLRVVGRENQTGQLGSATEKIVIPAPGNDRLQLSDVVLCAGESRVEEPSPGPLQVGSTRLIPSASRSFRPPAEVKMYLQVRASADPATTRLNLEITYQVLRNGAPISQNQELIAQPGLAHAVVPLVRRLPVNEMTPGQYELMVTVKDRATGQTESRRTEFLVTAGS
jgi:VWFA-related protein